MVTLSFQDNSIIFTFENSSHYLQGDGIIEAPKGSLALVTDESNMATFVKASSNDIFVSATYEELGMTKAQLLETFAENAGAPSGGGGDLTNYYTKQETNSLLDEKVDVSAYTAYTSATDSVIASKASQSDLEALSGDVADKADSTAVTAALADKLDVSAFNTYSGTIDSALADKVDTTAMTQALASKLDVSTFNTYSGTIDSALQGKADASALTNKVDVSAYTAYTSATDTAIAAKADSTAVTQALASKVDVSAFNTYSGDVDTALQGKVDTTALTDYVETTAMTQALADKVDTSAYTAYTSATQTTLNGKQNALTAGTNISIANDVVSVTGITSQTVVELTQAQYDALTTKDPNTFYIITDASGGGVTIDPTLDSGSTNAVANSAITIAINAKVDTSAYTAYTSATNTAIASKASQTDLNTVSAATASNTTALGGLKLVKLTQTEYDNLSVKDSSTIYFIVN